MAWVETRRIDVPRLPHETRIYFAADFQIGSDSTDLTIIRNWIRRVSSDKSALWCLLGDIEDDDRPTTREIRRHAFAGRTEVIKSDQKKHIRFLEQEVIPILSPLAKVPSLGILAGHHWTDLGELNSTQYICNTLSSMGQKVPYLGQMSAWTRLIFQPMSRHKSVQKLLHIQHGTGGGKTLASALNALKRTSEGFHADAYVRAHDCKLLSAKYDILAPADSDKPGLRHRTTVLMNIGSATRGYEIGLDTPNYAEMGMMSPQTLGWGMLRMIFHKQTRALDNNQGNVVDIKAEI